MEFLTTELWRIFLGTDIDWYRLLEVVFRTTFMYIYTIANVRLMDTRSMGMLTPFEIIIVVALGDLVGDPMTSKHTPLLPSMLTISTIVFIQRVLAKFSMKNIRFERLLNGKPVLIIKDGRLMPDALKKQNISKEEFSSILRLHGVFSVSEVKYAYLEPAGSISIIKKDEAVGVVEVLPENHGSQR